MKRKRRSTAQSVQQETGWAWLPDHLLDTIIEKLIFQSDDRDYIRFGAVCKAWLSVANHNFPKFQELHRPINVSCSFHLPMLMMFPSEDKNPEKGSLLNLVDQKKIDVQLPYNERFCGSSQGWLAFEHEDFNIILFHPLTGATIHLPFLIADSQNHFDVDDGAPYARKVILSADPTMHKDYVVAAVRGPFKDVVFMRSFDQAWKRTNLWRIEDVVYHRGRIYGVDCWGSLKCCDVVDPKFFQVVRREGVTWDSPDWGESRNYLVESTNGYLFVVKKFLVSSKDYENLMMKFFVQKLKCDADEKPRLCQAKHLDGHTFFLSDHHLMAVLASDYPGVCQPNSIYFADPYNGESDVGIYHLEGKKFVIQCNVSDPSQMDMPPPVRIELLE
ncbi:hypothetical protein Ancab_038094 [Ancistrocladus abbreviatus]